MPSDKAKANKALTAICAACNKPISTESAVALTGVENGIRKQYVACVTCANGGWRPPGFVGVYAVRPD